MSGPTRQRSLKERIRDGITLPLQRRRSTQSSGNKLTSKSYVINADTKNGKAAAESYGCPHNNLPEWNTTMNSTKKKSDDMISLHQRRLKDPSSAIADHKLLFKSPSEPASQHDVSTEKRQVARTMTQPTGTTTYTVKSSDTLTSIAARFDTTPSELVKLNRLASRFIFPAQVLYVPDKSLSSFDESADTEGGTTSTTNQVTDHASDYQASPKPGHVERVQSPVMSPTINPLTEEEERNLDRDCIEKFLKINVRHITDGQGVVCGVLLVTPNNVMFDPNVSDSLVIEHGPEKYGVIAPMDYVINAAMYNDIATMYVSHAPDRSVQPQPEVYHAKECLLSWQSTLSAPSWRPSRSDSEHAVNGSVSDMAEAGTPEEDRASLSSCQTPGSSALQNSDSTANLDSEVFLEENPHSSSSPTVSRKDTTCSSVYPKHSNDSVDRIDSIVSEIARSSDTDNTERNLSEAEVDDIKHDAAVVSEVSETAKSEQQGVVNDECVMTDVNVTNVKKDNIASETEEKIVQDEAAVVLTNPPLLPLDSSPKQHQFFAAAAAPSEQVLKESLTRKNSSSALDNKIKVLKRLSYPLTWMESFSSSEKDKENAPPLGSLSEVSTSNATPPPVTMASQATQQSSFSKMLYSSPKTLVDFSSGLFTRSSEDSVKEQVQPTKMETTSSTGENTIVPDITSAAGIVLPPTAVIKPGKACLVTGNNTVQTNQRAASFPQRRLDGSVAASVPRTRMIGSDHRCHSVVESVREPKVGFKSVVSVDDMPDLFASIDLLENFDEIELIPRPAKSCDDPPLYLCLRMGMPLNKKLPKNIPAMAYGKKCMKREYWFSIPRDRVDELYTFFNHWAPNVYGDLDDKAIAERGYCLILSEEEISDDESHHKDAVDGGSSEANSGDDASLSKSYSDWEMIKAPHMKLLARLRRDTNRGTSDSESFEVVVNTFDVSRQMSIDQELPLPDLIGKSEIMTEDHRKSISKKLPARAVGYAWSLIYSTSQNGFSLNNLYRKCSQYETPILLIIMDTDQNVFGVLTACSLRLSDHFYGTGESFLFTFFPEFQIFGWSGENTYFIKGNNDCLVFGSGDGVFGLWLDGDLYHGRSHPCKTYNNTMLTNKEDFHVKTLEAWGFVEIDTTTA